MFRRRKPPEPPPDWLVVGLGNPGREYEGTRHNVGWEVIDEIARRCGARLRHTKHYGLHTYTHRAGARLLLLKPLTFMNLSGNSVAGFVREHELPAERVLVVADDLDLPTGRVRMRAKGGSGGHRGHKSMIERLGTSDYPRIRIGIGKEGAVVDHVLSRFEPEERPLIEAAIRRAADTLDILLEQDLERAISFANSG